MNSTSGAGAGGDAADDPAIWMDYEIVEKVVDKRIGKDGKIEYLLKVRLLMGTYDCL